MKKAEFPSSKENVDKAIRLYERGESLVKEQRKALRNYLNSTASSNKLKPDVTDRANKIREILDINMSTRPDKIKIPYQYDESDPKSYRERMVVNGIEISVGWDRYYNDYTIYFPEITLEEGRKRGVNDQVIRITTLPDVAKQIFDHACKVAKEGNLNVYDVFKQVQEFSRDLPYDESEYEAAA